MSKVTERIIVAAVALVILVVGVVIGQNSGNKPLGISALATVFEGDLQVNGEIASTKLTTTGLTSIADGRITSLNASTTNVGVLTDYGNLTAQGGSINFATGTATTTKGLFIFGNTGTAISTVSVGSFTQQGCLEMFSSTGTPHTLKLVNSALVATPGRCN